MANRYANLVGSNKIKDEYTKINQGFDKVEQEMDAKPDRSIAQVNNVQMGTDDTLTIEGSTGITISTNPSQKKVTITATGTSTPGPHGPSHNNDGADPIPDLQDLTNAFDAHKADYEQNAIKRNGNVAMRANLTFSRSLVGLEWRDGNSDTTGELGNFPEVTDGVVTVRIFRNVNTTGNKRFQLLRGDGGAAAVFEIINGGITRLADTNVNILAGSVNPEGSVTAPQGSLYLRTDGNIYIKESGSGNTGWKVVQTA